MIAIAVKHLIAAGVTGDALIAAIAEMEASLRPVRTARQERNARCYERRSGGREWQNLREMVLELYEKYCVYCGADNPKTVDHVVPVSKGGGNGLDNLVPCCKACNSKKRDRDLQEWLQ